MKLRKDTKLALTAIFSKLFWRSSSIRNEETQILLLDPIFLIKWLRKRNVLALLLATKEGVSRS